MNVFCNGTAQKNVLANDYDPDNNTPLSLVSVSGPLYVTIVNSTTIEVTATSTPGATAVSYTVQDSLGATSGGTVTVTITGNPITCNL